MTTTRRTLGHTLAVITAAAVAFCSGDLSAATFDITSYTVPGGFEMLPGGPNHANFRRVDSGNWLLFGVYGSRAAASDLATEFAADWKDLSGAPRVAVPNPVRRTVGAGVAAAEGGALCPGIGYVDLLDIDAGGKVVSIIIESGSAEGFEKTYRKTIEDFLSSLVVRPAAKGAPVAKAAPVGIPATLSARDLIGHWYASDHSTASYVDANTGNYAGSSATFYGLAYDMAADGTFTSHFRGMANGHIVDEKGSGRWELTADRVIVSNGSSTTRYQLIGSQKSGDGSMQIDLLDERYPPQSGNIALYAEHWRRTPDR